MSVSALPPEVKNRILATIPLGRLGTPEEIATLALYLASPAAAFVTGHTFFIDGGVIA